MSATPNFAAETFNGMFAAITNEVTFNPNWANGTGYYDGAIKGEHAVTLAPGEMAKCMSNNERKMIFVGTRFGTFVIFERFSGGENGVHVMNMPTKLSQLGLVETGGRITSADMTRMIGNKWDHKPNNLGTLIEAVIEAAGTSGNDEAH